MKMHSYSDTNLEFYQDMLEAKKNDKKGNLEKLSELTYPNNVNFRNFQDFMWMPTLVYRMSYPRTKEIRINYLIVKGSIVIILIIFSYYVVSDSILAVM